MMERHAAHTCLNCDLEYTGKFCPECGQKQHTHRITAGTVVHEIPHSVFHLDKGFFYTFTQLLKRPGHTLREYIAGKRVKHYSPVAYLLIMTAASTLMSHVMQLYLEHFYGQKFGVDMRVYQYAGTMFFRKYPAFMFAVIIPFISIWSWLFNRRSKYNYWENFVLNTYLVAQFNVFFIVNDLVFMALGKTYGSFTPMLTAFFFYLMFAYAQLFRYKHSSFKQVLKRVLMYLLIIITVLQALTMTGYMTEWWTVFGK